MAKIQVGNKIISKKPSSKLVKCCACNGYYDIKDNIFLSYNGKMLICPFCGLKHLVNFSLFYGEKPSLVKISELKLDIIDIGNPAIDRASDWSSSSQLVILQENPANTSGKITSVEVWANIDLVGFVVGTVYNVSGLIFTSRDYELIGAVVRGAKRTFTVDIDVEAGDYIAYCNTSGGVDRGGGGNIWYKSSQAFPFTGKSFINYGSPMLSLYGIGETPVPPIKDSARTGIYSFKTSI